MAQDRNQALDGICREPQDRKRAWWDMQEAALEEKLYKTLQTHT